MEHVVRIERNLVKKGVIFDYYQDTMKTPTGELETFDFIGHKGAAAMVAVRADGKLLLVRQYRNALDRETIEIPAGGLNGAEEPTKLAALRELKEETGYEAKDAILLQSIYTTVAFCNEKIDIYLATDLGKQGAQELDEDEYVDVEAYDLETLLQMILDCQIQDSKTICGILAYAAWKNRKEKN